MLLRVRPTRRCFATTPSPGGEGLDRRMSNLVRLERRLAQAVERYERVEARLAAATDGAEIVRLGQEHAELKPLVDAVAALNAKRAEIAGLEAMLKDSGGD